MLLALTVAVLVAIAVGVFAVAGNGEEEPDTAAEANVSTGTTQTTIEPSDTPAPTLAELVHTAADVDATTRACNDLIGVLRNAQTTARGHIREANSVPDRRAAAAYVASHRWARQTVRHEVTLATALHNLLRSNATLATERSDRAAVVAYTDAFVLACDATDTRTAVTRAAQAADAAIHELRADAKHAPWWPVGYAEVADGVAYQALAQGEYSCDMFACLMIRVVTRDGCDTLYIEKKVLDGDGQVIDFSNDMLSGLDPGEIGIMDFVVTADGSGFTLRMTDVSCY